MGLSFKKRIALLNVAVVAVIMAIVFAVIYGVVYRSSYKHQENDIQLEKAEVMDALRYEGDSLIIQHLPEWEEAEHRKVEANPTFMQLYDMHGHVVFHSANLQQSRFRVYTDQEKDYFFDGTIEKQDLRAGQFPVRNEQNRIIGFLTIGISRQESGFLLQRLQITFLISFVLLLAILYGIMYFTASRVIAPVDQLIRKATVIHAQNLHDRLPLPARKDELYQLAQTVNELLQRIESGVQLQKQFTADASHEIRTPLAAIQGTLEVLLRKKREPEQYEEKIKEVLRQTARISAMVDQLLQLARLETAPVKKENLDLQAIVQEHAERWQTAMQEKQIHFSSALPVPLQIQADRGFMLMILENLFSNAVKYCLTRGQINCRWDEHHKIFFISNTAEPVDPDQLDYFFDRFYRSDHSRSSSVPGTGLGLSLVKKLADLQDIRVKAQQRGSDMIFSLQFPQ